MESYAKRFFIGKVSEQFNKPSVVETDAELRAAIEEALATTKRHWWHRQPQPDIILSANDRTVLRTVKQRAWYLDKGCQCCCFSIGLDPIIGLIPGIGDAIGLILGLQVVRLASRADIPKSLVLQMLGNVVADFLLGLTPVAGDILDALFKCNWRNAMLLEEYLMLRRRDEIRAEKGLIQRGLDEEGGSSSAPATHNSPARVTIQMDPPQEESRKSGYGTFFSWFRS
ncbi:hypothetical protein DFQ28_009629 [Apophysomyces sp. BC1034]|nr:hypothetical protein DFQ30_004286 [Apophysomyces sp. BC1015]KAG0172553.1 hypothetical protein DFQ29_008323 [Apophysomyces sp. BC1021]KAG0185265.1 hypothetical protein DFQ28_009629 [Apophysomyces sp. BC1034]